MSYKFGVLLCAFLFVQLNANGQKSSDGYFYDTLVVMDYTTNYASERLSRLKKPLKRTFYLKSSTLNYTLFKGDVANLTADQVIEIVESGFGLYFDKQEYKGHKNLKPGILEILTDNEEGNEVIEDLGSMKESMLRRKLTQGTSIKLSGFIVSVNEQKLGPIEILVKIVE